MKTTLLLLALLVAGCKSIDIPPIPIPTPEPQPTAMPAKPATLCEPEKGIECMTPFGKDIRGLAYSGSKRIFIGCKEWVDSLTVDGKTIRAAHEWQRNGIRYVLAGCNAPSSKDPVLPQDAIEYRKTTRFYYWATREPK